MSLKKVSVQIDGGIYSLIILYVSHLPEIYEQQSYDSLQNYEWMNRLDDVHEEPNTNVVNLSLTLLFCFVHKLF